MKYKYIGLATLLVTAACAGNGEKGIYIPQELATNDFNDPGSDWSYSRMLKTPNLAIFWEKGFGDDLSCPPDLEGHKMDIDLANLADKLESFYQFFTDSLQFVLPGSKAEKTRMMVMLRYSLEGTAYGGDYDQEIGALWVTPNRLRDTTLNCIAHELGHSFQSQITCDGQGEAWGGCGFFEMASQWMLWQVNPNWVNDEDYHFYDFRRLTHRAFLHLDNIYHSPYVLEAWSEKHGKPFIAELFRNGKIGEDPAMTYQRLAGISQEEFCDEMYAIAAKIVNLDFPRTWDYTRECANTFSTPMHTDSDGWMRPDSAHCVENYGFNVVPLTIVAPGATATVTLESGMDMPGYYCERPDLAGWRYGIVGITTEGRSIYGKMAKQAGQTATLTVPDNEELQSMYAVVMGAPTEHLMLNDRIVEANQWPYRIKTVRSQ